jgi:hypothetical protein
VPVPRSRKNLARIVLLALTGGLFIGWLSTTDRLVLFQTRGVALCYVGGGNAFVGAFRPAYPNGFSVIRAIDDRVFSWPPIAFDKGIRVAIWLIICCSLAALHYICRKDAFNKTQCYFCSYELIGNQSGVCPECGTPIPPEQRSAIAVILPTTEEIS